MVFTFDYHLTYNKLMTLITLTSTLKIKINSKCIAKIYTQTKNNKRMGEQDPNKD